MIDIKEDLLQFFTLFFDKKSDSLPDKTAKGSDIKSMSNQQLENKPIIRQLKQEEFLLDLRKMLALLI